MSQTEGVKTFIGANSPKGNGIHRDSLYDPARTDCAILIKGGPGNGKSTLMSCIAAGAEARGMAVERVYCPSDPRSLDAVVCEGLGLAMVDATPPHVREADTHCLPEVYLSLSAYVDPGVVRVKNRIFELNALLKDARSEADKCIKAAYEADSELCGEVLTYADTGLLSEMGSALAGEYLPGPAKKPGAYRPMKRRFISALAPEGVCSDFFGTPYALCGKMQTTTVALRDELGLSPFVLGAAADEAQRRGFSVWGFFDPLVCSRLAGLCVPEIGLCFLPENAARDPVQVADTAECISPGSATSLGAKPEVLLSVKKALIAESRERLAECLKVHDAIEAEYRPYMDLAGLDALAKDISEKFIKE